MESLPMLEMETLQLTDEEPLVHEWRVEQLRRLRLQQEPAEAFADVVDWHAVGDLVARGCPPELALKIVW
jgi:hypothetical protein